MNNIELSLIIPAYNESKIIVGSIDELAQWMADHLPATSFEIVVVNDGSTDGMGGIIEEAMKARPWLTIAHHSRNFGRGRGVRTGFAASTGQYVICLDADLSYAPAIIPSLLNPLKSGDVEITLASAHHPEGKLINVPSQRATLSKWGNSILSMGFEDKLHTVTCVVRGFSRQVINDLELVSDGKELHLEIIQKAQLLGFKMLEVPTTLEWRDRKRGQKEKSSFLPEIAIFKMRRTVLSHLVFNYVTNPGVLLFIPLLTLLAVILSTSATLLASFISKLTEVDLSIFQALRATFIDGQLSLLILLFSVIIFMVFLIFYFLSYQSKRYFEESYILMMRMNTRIKDLERKQP